MHAGSMSHGLIPLITDTSGLHVSLCAAAAINFTPWEALSASSLNTTLGQALLTNSKY
jgi:hypothetical protein